MPEAKAKPKYKHGDMTRPRPKVVDPGTPATVSVLGFGPSGTAVLPDPTQVMGSQGRPARPPSDAVVLFDGKDLSAWQSGGKGKKDNPERQPKWKVENGYFEVAPRTGTIETKEKFGDVQVHLEWATPLEVKGNSQGRGNSGVYFGGFGEVQVLDSYQNDTYPDGQAAALYNKFPPLVNASRKPGEWQTYDIIAHLPRLNEEGKVVRPGLMTVLHNGVLVHHAVEFAGKIGPYSIVLQDHGNPVRYRNFWVRRLKDYDEDGTPPPPAPPKPTPKK